MKGVMARPNTSVYFIQYAVVSRSAADCPARWKSLILITSHNNKTIINTTLQRNHLIPESQIIRSK